MAHPNSNPVGEQNLLRQILDRLNKADEHNRAQFESLATENKRRAEEIEQLSKTLQFTILTETGSSHHSRAPVRSEDSEDDEARDRPHNSPAPGRMGPQSTAEASDPLRAQEAIELVETLRGQDDIGVEDFIKNVKYARSQCHQKMLLLKLILVKKITDNAKRSIRFLEIETYEDLYNALRQNIATPSTVSNCRDRLRNTKQGPTENVQSYNLRFRRQLNELVYALQNKHSKPVSRRIAIDEELEDAIKTYMFNLRDDIGHYVIPSQPDTLLKAQNLASEIEMHIRERSSRKPTTTPTQRHSTGGTPPLRRPGAPPTTNDRRFNELERRPLSERASLKCTKCGRTGHTQDRCYARNFPSADRRNLPPHHRANHTIPEREEDLEETTEYELTARQSEDCYPYYSTQDKEDDQEDSLSIQEQV